MRYYCGPDCGLDMNMYNCDFALESEVPPLGFS